MQEIEWVEVARRGENHNLLMIDLVMRTYLRNLCGESFGKGVVFVPKHYRQFAGGRSFGSEDMQKYVSLLRQACESGRIAGMGEEYEKQIDSTREYAQKMRGKSFSGAEASHLAAEIKEFFEVAIKHWGQAYHYIFLNRFLPDEVTAEVARRAPDLKRQTEILLTFFSSDKPTEMREENIALVALAEKMREEKIALSSGRAHELIGGHLEKYAHLGRYYYRSSDYTAEQIAARISHLTREEIAKKKAEFAEQQKVPEKTREIVKQLGFGKKTVEKIYAIKQYSFCSNHADEAYNILVSSCAALIKNACKLLDCSWNEFAAMQSTEILAALEKGTPLSDGFKRELRERHKDHAIVLQEGKISVLSGEKLVEYAGRERKSEENYSHLQELRGTGASPGKASGKVALVLTTKELGKVKKGDILVTSMTTPEFVPAMERAAAIVTDDGGVLCHAAIVSRELNRPCVVGTKHATKALRDGDLVEVDATKGIVRKIDE